jgi:DNA-binding NtrC family response regulator
MVIQNKLLKFLQDQSLIKNNKAVKLDIRFITSSTKDMQEEIAQGKSQPMNYEKL